MYSKFGQFIDGKWQTSEKKETYDVINPATEDVIGKASKASPVDVDKALKSALTNNQLTLSLKNKKLMLGTWQGLYLFEHRLEQYTRILSHHLIGD